MFFLLSVAIAAPLSPIVDTITPEGIGFSLGTTTALEGLQDSNCSSDDCIARRVENRFLMDLEIRPFPAISFFLQGYHQKQSIDAATFDGQGWGGGGGIKAGMPLGRYGLDGWLSLNVDRSKNTALDPDHGQRMQVELGAAPVTPGR